MLLTLQGELEGLGFALDDAQLEQLAGHWALVKEWNRRMNLTAIMSDSRAASLHYRDSLELLKVVGAGRVVDLGSGAGFPGVPLAIARPAQHIVLVEPRRKRASFLRTVKNRLQLSQVEVLEARSEHAPPQLFDWAVTRATFSDRDDLLACLQWLRPGGQLVAMRAAADASHQSTQRHRYEVDKSSRILESFVRGESG